jgi:hypothetical protein
MSDRFEGGCICGAVRFVATGPPKWVSWCHCESCRRHSGAPVSVFVAFERSAYTVTKGEITKFNSSPRTRRGFCAQCGSTLTCESERLPTETHFHVGAFDQAAEFKPTRPKCPWRASTGEGYWRRLAGGPSGPCGNQTRPLPKRPPL